MESFEHNLPETELNSEINNTAKIDDQSCKKPDQAAELSKLLYECMKEPDDEIFIKKWGDFYSANKSNQYRIPRFFWDRFVGITRNKILAEFSGACPEEIQMNIDKAIDFVAKREFPISPFVVVDKNNDFSKIQEICREYMHLYLPTTICRGNEGEAVYDNVLKMIFVFRNDQMESLNEKNYAAENLVHEQIHATSEYEFKQETTKDEHKVVEISRLGFALLGRGYGFLLEEGYAQHYAGEFMAKNYSLEYNQKKAEAMGVDHVDPEEMHYYQNDFLVLPLPAKYLIFHSGGLGAPSSALAGFTMDLLFEANPELEEYAKEARSSAEGIKKVHRVLNKLSPGLYLELQKTDYDTNQFFEKLALVIEKTKGSVEKTIASTIRNNEGLNKIWKEKLGMVEWRLEMFIKIATENINRFKEKNDPVFLDKAQNRLADAEKIIKFPYEFAAKYQKEFEEAKNQIGFYAVRQPLTK